MGRLARLMGIEKREGSTLHVIGLVIFGLSAFMLVAGAVNAFTGDSVLPFLMPGIPGLVVGLVLTTFFRVADVIRPVNGLFMLGSVWFVGIFFGAVPYLLSDFSVPDAIFESTSGFTTCGASIWDGSRLSMGILLWRSMSQWIGGIAIILIFLFIMPLIGFGGRAMFGNEIHGSGAPNFTARMKDAGRQFILIYVGLTVVMLVIMLLIGPDDAFGSLCITLSTVSTGGFLYHAGSMEDYGLLVKWVIILFMFLGGTNFYLHYKAALSKDVRKYSSNAEFRTMLFWFGFLVVIILYLLYDAGIDLSGKDSFFENYTEVSFSVVSMATSTGFGSSDYTTWTHGAIVLLFLAVFIGSSAGSTGGGVKISRLIIVLTYVRNGFRKLIYPNAVFDVKYNGKSLDDNTVNAAVVVFIMFMATAVFGTLVVLLHGIPINEAITTTIACLADTGPATGSFGPLDGYGSAPSSLKFFYSLLMWMGRLEMTAALALLMPGFWKELISRGR